MQMSKEEILLIIGTDIRVSIQLEQGTSAQSFLIGGCDIFQVDGSPKAWEWLPV